MALWPKKLGYDGGSGIIEVAAYDAGVLTARPDGTNEDAIITVLDGLTYTDVGDFQSPVFSTVKDNEQEYRSGKCNVGTFAKTFEQREQIDFSLLDVNDPELLKTLVGGNYSTSLTDKTWSYNFEAITATNLVVKFTSCDLNGYDISYADDGNKKLVDTIYIVKSTVSSDIPRQYRYLAKETLEGSTVTINGELGGYMIHRRTESAI